MPRRYVNFIIVPEDKSEGIKLRLSTLAVKFLLGIILVVVVVMAIMSIFYVKALSIAMLNNELKKENQRLREYNSKVVQMEKELEDYRSFFSRVANLAGVDQDLIAKNGERVAQVLGNTLDSTVDYSIGPQEVDTQVADIPSGLPLGGWISRDFSTEHKAIDIAAKEGTEVKAAADGVVKFVGWDETFGNLIILKHKGDIETYYGHNQKILVKPNQKVKKGETISLSGNTGKSTAPHLHYEIKKDDKSVNPWNYMGKKR
ncbi:MAG TPA: M23 family metallopeptidase [candidate division Zixibacteria bacterium]